MKADGDVCVVLPALRLKGPQGAAGEAANTLQPPISTSAPVDLMLPTNYGSLHRCSFS